MCRTTTLSIGFPYGIGHRILQTMLRMRSGARAGPEFGRTQECRTTTGAIGFPYGIGARILRTMLRMRSGARAGPEFGRTPETKTCRSPECAKQTTNTGKTTTVLAVSVHRLTEP